MVSPSAAAPLHSLLLGIYLAATTLVAVLICLAWFMSPLGLGFAEWPEDPGQRRLALRLFEISYHLGLPVLIVTQLASAWLAARGRRKLAFLLPAMSIGSFGILIKLFLAQMG
ncbi:hypothetical protein [Paracoccus siganidrum]|uniref:Uncharacterized protein n=1 Tax=Paracoccus siganidrum TaxID=1276757 RepID=A0A419A588_9RHOB|nr:hypothetical protein [Paracoccus siganidrum]RJL10868.1 hypothetical protein D3P05_13515 [Paracoccus siganidrum]RMC28956.1 hypothetical protein C9E82_20855 [Paracoccus siganidrum]